MPYPNFLGIGAMKGGTTWLDRNLRAHPKIWLPPVKELRYFEKHMMIPPKTPLHALFHKRYRNTVRLRKLTQPSVRKEVLSDPLWACRYFFGRKTDRWYASLFQPQEGQIAGEISPDYAKLDEETVKHVHDLMPNLKILFLLRNPIERAWSHILWDFCGGDGPHNLGTLDLEACKKHATSRSSRVRGEYTKTLRVWETYYPRERMFVGFFEEMRDTPEELLKKIEQFLGVSEFVPESVRRKINENPGPEMPPELKKHLAVIYSEELDALAKRFGGITEKWRYEALSMREK